MDWRVSARRPSNDTTTPDQYQLRCFYLCVAPIQAPLPIHIQLVQNDVLEQALLCGRKGKTKLKGNETWEFSLKLLCKPCFSNQSTITDEESFD
mmetsp:Transcript_3764/g.5916  ORF Transcript_3764/g.5916 Transcript_3764/m.5916 type:complete len:94 (-) Transcript_3764:44-325(-)